MTDTLPYVAARHQGASRSIQSIDYLVVHTMEAPEKGTTAESVANYFANLDRVASAHLCVDADSMVECVKADRVAYAAGGGNAKGYHYELAGYAAQSGAEWADPYSVATLFRAAEHMAGVSLMLNIPAVFIGADALKRGERGITTHAAITAAFKKSTHTDPGPNFPMQSFIELVEVFRAKLLGTPPPPPAPIPPVSSIPAAWQRPSLGLANQGNPVKNLQIELKFVTGAPAAVDGDYGPATKAAVENFQRFFGLNQDRPGFAGRQTWFMLDCLVVSKGGKLVTL